MSSIPETPEQFSAQVADLVRSRHPGRKVELVATLVVTIDGRHLGLENLWRTVQRTPETWLETVEHHIDRVLEGDQMSSLDIPFAVAKPRIMPRIQPSNIFQTLDREQVAHVPWVNDTVIVFVMDMPHYTVSISTEQMLRWGVCAEDLEEIARARWCAPTRAGAPRSSACTTATTPRGCCSATCTRASPRSSAGPSTSPRRRGTCSWR